MILAVILWLVASLLVGLIVGFLLPVPGRCERGEQIRSRNNSNCLVTASRTEFWTSNEQERADGD